jgi:predicted nucleic acid-binding protein
VTHPRIYSPPTPLAKALDQVDSWLESPTLDLLAEPVAHWPTLRTMLANGRIMRAQVHDALVAALCQQHGVRELWSADRDFSRFGGLVVVNPLLAEGAL